MECRHCGVNFHFELVSESIYKNDDWSETEEGWRIGHGFCPNCNGLIIVRDVGVVEDHGPETYLATSVYQDILYPLKSKFNEIPVEVPEKYANDLKEARDVIKASPKASAAISRRILQQILREELQIKRANLSKEIDDFIQLKDIPSYLSGAVDAVRNVGNFAAHPIKDTNTGEIADVEAGEAEWLLDVLDSLYDFVFVQPKKLEQRKKQLNEKLRKLGKEPMKGS